MSTINDSDPPLAVRTPLPSTLRARTPFRRPAVWVFGLIVAALASTLTAVFSGVLGNWIDVQKAGDALAPNEAVRLIAAEETDPGYGWALPEDVTATQLSKLVDGTTEKANNRVAPLEDVYRSMGGLPLNYENVQITLEGERSVPVRIVNMVPHIISCAQGIHGTLLLSHPEGEDDEPNLAVNFDKDQPLFREVNLNSDTSPSPPYFDFHTLSLAKDELLTIYVKATVTSRSCIWDLEVHEIVDGKTQVQIVGATRPWRITGFAPLASFKERYLLRYLYVSFGVPKAGSQWALEPLAWFCKKSCSSTWWRDPPI